MPRLLPIALLAPALAMLLWLALGRVEPRADFVVAGDQVRTIDPHRASFADELAIAGALFEGLTRLNERTFLPEPGAAERWETCEDGRRYVFHLRPEARWSNGEPLLAEHFVRAWEYVLDPACEAQYAAALFVIDGAEAYYRAAGGVERPPAETLGVRAIDARTLELRLAAPCPYLLEILSFPIFAPVYPPLLERFVYRDGRVLRGTRHLWLRPEHIVGNGAFRLVKWDFKERFLLARNEHYWDRDVCDVETIEFYLAPSGNAAQIAYETGRVDMLRGLDAEVALELRRQQETGRRRDFRLGDRFATFFLRVNCRRPPLDDADLRRALALAIDKDELCRHVMGLGEQPADHYVPWHLLAGGAAAPPAGLGMGLSRAARLTEARRLLSRSRLGATGGGRPLELAYAPEPAAFRRVCEAVAEMWRRDLGLRVELRALEPRVLSERIRRLDYDVVRSNWFGDYSDPMTFLDMFTSHGAQNRTGWADAEYDALIAAAAREPVAARRIELLQAAERRLCLEELPIIPLFFMRGNALLNPRFELADSQRGVPQFHRVRRAAAR
ncbi:MAG: peptide ABC transporter substrate-binding protein [Phycisphaerae bacterium]|jgi:oligopeptide transport system substrate-binding protein|nr:peptide ABC transporter substrate-binding protein [Phycisphaerae bacterium]MCZ2400671.1 peptide ABC transporter substrate-binding protein [Phycisphaerae bacterium]